MPARKHAVITGTGRSGTTFLVELLTNLGLDTGFTKQDIEAQKNNKGNAGLELDIRKDSCPYIVKSPFFCDYANEIINREDITIDHVFVPIRNLNAAAESRRFVTQANIKELSFIDRIKNTIKPRGWSGGLWHTQSRKKGSQEQVLLMQVYKLLLSISQTQLPITILQYPKLTKDAEYVYEKLKPVLGDINLEKFSKVFNETVRPDLVHSFNENDR